jgi:hypothetical protein
MLSMRAVSIKTYIRRITEYYRINILKSGSARREMSIDLRAIACPTQSRSVFGNTIGIVKRILS